MKYFIARIINQNESNIAFIIKANTLEEATQLVGSMQEVKHIISIKESK